jgi:hypothetical protein
MQHTPEMATGVYIGSSVDRRGGNTLVRRVWILATTHVGVGQPSNLTAFRQIMLNFPTLYYNGRLMLSATTP